MYTGWRANISCHFNSANQIPALTYEVPWFDTWQLLLNGKAADEMNLFIFLIFSHY